MRPMLTFALGASLFGCGSTPAAPAQGAGGGDDAGTSDAAGSGGGAGAGGDPGTTDSGGPAWTLAHDFPPFDIGASEESDTNCQQWTPGHAETLYVSSVQMRSEGAFHHMNFFFVPETMMQGPDGTFVCKDRGYDLQLAAIAGGVFYAQSTQTKEELMKFGAGAAIPVPPGYKIVGNQHLLNASPDTVHTHLRFEIGTIPEAEVTARLTGLTFQYGALDIAPHSHTRFTTACDMAGAAVAQTGAPLDFGIHYLLPHYHRLGELMRLELVGGARDGEVLLETTKGNGESVGAAFDPPISLKDAQSVRLTCGFDNPTADSIVWGIGKNEMCIMFGFSDSDRLWSAGDDGKSAHSIGTVDGAAAAESNCSVLSAIPTAPK